MNERLRYIFNDVLMDFSKDSEIRARRADWFEELYRVDLSEIPDDTAAVQWVEQHIVGKTTERSEQARKWESSWRVRYVHRDTRGGESYHHPAVAQSVVFHLKQGDHLSVTNGRRGSSRPTGNRAVLSYNSSENGWHSRVKQLQIGYSITVPGTKNENSQNSLVMRKLITIHFRLTRSFTTLSPKYYHGHFPRNTENFVFHDNSWNKNSVKNGFETVIEHIHFNFDDALMDF